MFSLPRLECLLPLPKKIKIRVRFLRIFTLLIPLFLVFAAPAIPGEILRYQVVTSGVDNAYLVDTTTGFTWILTYRTLPTGREPVAIPYKFIGVTPHSQTNFLMENAPIFPDQAKESK